MSKHIDSAALTGFCSGAENDHFSEEQTTELNPVAAALMMYSVLVVGAGHFLFMQKDSLAHSSGVCVLTPHQVAGINFPRVRDEKCFL